MYQLQRSESQVAEVHARELDRVMVDNFRTPSPAWLTLKLICMGVPSELLVYKSAATATVKVKKNT